MIFSEYIEALSKMPINFKNCPYQDIKICEFSGFLIAAAGSFPPIYYKNDEWLEMPIGRVS